MFIGSAQNTTLLPPSAGAPEHYEELWWYSGGYEATSTTASGSIALQKGGTCTALSTSASAQKLLTLSSNWQATTKFALECTITGNGGASGNAALWDMTANAIVSGSTVTTTNNGQLAVFRSGLFSLTPGHTYGVTVWSSSVSYNMWVTDASLIIFSQ